MLAERPVDRGAVNAHKARMIDEVRAYRLQELRESVAMTQKQLAERLGVGQNRVSNIEHGDLERVQIDTLRRYVEASAEHYASRSNSATSASRSRNTDGLGQPRWRSAAPDNSWSVLDIGGPGGGSCSAAKVASARLR